MIERYEPNIPMGRVEKHDDGDYVKYKDHRALLDKANAAIKEAYQRGKEEGYRQGKMQAEAAAVPSWRL